jgi:serine protease SohB
LEYLYEYGLFLAQAFTVVLAILLIAGGLLTLGQRQRTESIEGHIEIRKLNDRYKAYGDAMQHAVMDAALYKKERKARKKKEKKAAKAAGKAAADESAERRRLFVLNFDGDLKASATDDLREEISAVLGSSREGDEVLLRLESGGGLVHSYGLASSQLQRIVAAGVTLTVSVDKVAASGGYMMACVGQRILAAPFAVIGSIGVLAQLPNFHRLLQKANVDFEQLTAGEYKRTLTLFGENTEEGRSKLQEEIEDTHALFKDFVSLHRPQVQIDDVATGEVWYGQRAIERGLVDELQTSDSYVQESLGERDVFEVRHIHRKSWQEKLGVAVEGGVARALMKLWSQALRRNNW